MNKPPIKPVFKPTIQPKKELGEDSRNNSKKMPIQKQESVAERVKRFSVESNDTKKLKSQKSAPVRPKVPTTKKPFVMKPSNGKSPKNPIMANPNFMAELNKKLDQRKPE